MSNKILIPLCMVLSAAAGALASYAVVRAYPVKKEVVAVAPPPPVPDKQITQLQKDMVDLQARFAKLESRPDFNTVMNDPSLRQQLAAAIEATKSPASSGPRPAPQDSDAWRHGIATRLRQDYGKLVEEALDAMKVQGQDRQKAKAELDAHFEPVEAHLRKLELKEVSSPPKVNELVSGQLASTLGRLQKAVPAEAFAAFDAWRKAPGGALAWGQGKSDYFMSGNDFSESQVNAAVEMNWQLLTTSLSSVWNEGKVGEEKQKKLEPILKQHLRQVFSELRKDELPNMNSPKALARNQAFTNVTESAMLHVIGKDGVELFRKWKISPGNRCCYFFGVQFRAPERVVPESPAPLPAPEKPAGTPPF